MRDRRKCAESGCDRYFIPKSSRHRYCLQHRRTRPKNPTEHALRYGWSHRRLRQAWAPRVRSGKVNCARCGTPVYPGEDWDLGHEDGTGRVVAGTHPEHARCNRATNRGSSGRRVSVDLGGERRVSRES